MSLDVNLNNFIVLTVSIQFVFFGWRLVREIAVGDKDTGGEVRRRASEGTSRAVWQMWLPLPDIVNLLSLCLIAVSCVIFPVATGQFTPFGQAALVAAVVLWMCHPFSTACHYELFRGGRQVVYGDPRNWPRFTRSEILTVIISVILAVISGYVTWYQINAQLTK